MHVLVARGVETEGSSIVFSGDTDGNHLEKLAMDADVRVAHNAIPRSATGSILDLHILPSTCTSIAKSWKGDLQFANDLDCLAVKPH